MRKKFPYACQDLDNTVSHMVLDILEAVDKYVEGKAKDGMEGWLTFVGIRSVYDMLIKERRRRTNVRIFSFGEGYDPIDYSQDPTCYEPLADEIIAEQESTTKKMKWNVLARKRLRLKNAHRP